MSGFSSVVHLIGRHPELTSYRPFRVWLATHGGDIWHETHRSEHGLVTVVVQSLDRFHLFAAQTRIAQSENLRGIQANVVVYAEFDLFSKVFSRTQAARILLSKIKGSDQIIQAIRPVVDFNVTPADLHWEIEVLEKPFVHVFRLYDPDKIEMLYERRLQPAQLVNTTSGEAVANDWLDTNELQHPALFVDEALQWVQGCETVVQKAYRIWRNVNDSYVYDATIKNIEKFTFADILVRDVNGRAGVCDEFAVIQVSYLRALGIPAGIKFLTFRFGGQLTAHACCEFQDETGRSIHMDALYADAFDRPSIYRSYTAKDVRVMDADFPCDKRSAEPAYGIPDPPGDLQLNPYTDFILQPEYPGNARSGYSY
jgi:transglutaminase-like putative cysteine protease